MQVNKSEEELRDLLKGVIRRLGWENVKENFNFKNIASFDIVADRKILLGKHFLLITFIKQFDNIQLIAQQKETFLKITKLVQSHTWGKMFIYVIIGDNISKEIIILLDQEKSSHVSFTKSGGGYMIFVDLQSKKCYGEDPPLSIPTKYVIELKQAIEEALGSQPPLKT